MNIGEKPKKIWTHFNAALNKRVLSRYRLYYYRVKVCVLVQRNSKNNKLDVSSRNIGFLYAQQYLIFLY